MSKNVRAMTRAAQTTFDERKYDTRRNWGRPHTLCDLVAIRKQVSLLRKNGGSLPAPNALSGRELLNAANGNQSGGIRSARNSARTNEGLKPDVPCGAVGNRNPEGSLKLMAVLSLEQKSSGGLSTFLL